MRIFVLVLVLAMARTSMAQKCLSQSYYNYKGTLTAYENVRGDFSEPGGTASLHSDPCLKCEAMQVWHLSRHGARFPKEDETRAFRKLVEVRDQVVKGFDTMNETEKNTMCAKLIEGLRGWKLNENLKLGDGNKEKFKSQDLVEQGKHELESIGIRLRKAFPKLFKTNYTSEERAKYFKFETTETNRTRESLKSFYKGLLCSNLTGCQSEVDGKHVVESDSLLRMHKYCNEFRKSYSMYNSSAERDDFIHSSRMKEVVKGVSERIGLKKLDYKSIFNMYKLCSFETAWNNSKASPWCSIFNEEDMKVFEYCEDLDYYYCCGPGRKDINKLGCPIVKNMFNHFNDLVKSNFTNQPKGLFFFSHSPTLQAVMAALNINVDIPGITAASYPISANRNYKTSLYNSFATSVNAVFYRCTNVTSNSSFNKVLFRVAENSVKVPGCDGNVCDWDHMNMWYGSTVSKCSFDFCSATKSAAVTTSNGKVMLGLILSFALSQTKIL